MDNFFFSLSAVEALWKQGKKIFTAGVDKFVCAMRLLLFFNELEP